MPRYTVHLFPIVRVAVQVDADNPKAAILKAEQQQDLYQHFDGLTNTEFAEEMSHYLVDDETNDPDHEHSQFYPGENIRRYDVAQGLKGIKRLIGKLERLT